MFTFAEDDAIYERAEDTHVMVLDADGLPLVPVHQERWWLREQAQKIQRGAQVQAR